MKITESMTLGEIYNLACLKESKDYLIGGGAGLFQASACATLQKVQRRMPAWSATDMAYGLERLREIAESGVPYFFSVYSEAEIREEPEKKNVRLFYFPGTNKGGRYAILLSGGGYESVCSMVESFPVAAKLNEAGITVFCLNYRIHKPGMTGVLPKPIDDLAAAWRFLSDHASELGIVPENYAVGGFSAGGHIAAEWGTANKGARKYGLPQPRMLLLGYPMITTERMREETPREFWQHFFKVLFGADYDRDIEAEYSVNLHMDGKYPPTYIVQSKNDGEVPFWNLTVMKKALDESGVTYRAEESEDGGHGFGLGSATDIAGWIERAVEFWDVTLKEII